MVVYLIRLFPGLNITSPPSGQQSTVVTSPDGEEGLKARSGVSNMSYTSFEHDISNLLDDSIFAGKLKIRHHDAMM